MLVVIIRIVVVGVREMNILGRASIGDTGLSQKPSRPGAIE